MGLKDLVRRNRAAIAREMGSGRYGNFSAAYAARVKATRDLIARHAKGRVLDVGCGYMPFKRDVLAVAGHYDGMDLNPAAPGLMHVGDVQAMDGIADAQYDTVCCFEVLEHVPHPGRAIAEMARVLKPGGLILLTAPHLSRLHEEPHDYYRYTRHGLRQLAVDGGLDVVEIAPFAGLASFTAHQFSTLLVTVAWSVPLIRQLVYGLNCLLLVWPVLWLDRVLDRDGLMALGYCMVAAKPQAATGEAEHGRAGVVFAQSPKLAT